MTEHLLEEHKGCERIMCPICEGGLAYCMVCKGAEAQLPTECPGRVMTERECELVMAGTTDFINGKWQEPTERSVNRPRLSI